MSIVALKLYDKKTIYYWGNDRMGRGFGKTKKVLLQKCHSFRTNQEFFQAYFETSSKPDGRTFKKKVSQTDYKATL